MTPFNLRVEYSVNSTALSESLLSISLLHLPFQFCQALFYIFTVTYNLE